MGINMKRWVAIVYDAGDKIGSHTFQGDESKARSDAADWVVKNFGENRDWSLHEVQDKS